MKKLKVWGGYSLERLKPLPNGDMQARTIVAAKTKKRMLELLAPFHVSKGYFDGYWAETGNEVELAVACEEGVWCMDLGPGMPRTAKDYRRLA